MASVRTINGGQSNREFVVQGLSYMAQTTEVFKSGALQPGQGDVSMACGRTVTDAGLRVGFTVTVNDDVAQGTYPADAEAGLTVVNSSEYVDADCPR